MNDLPLLYCARWIRNAFENEPISKRRTVSRSIRRYGAIRVRIKAEIVEKVGGRKEPIVFYAYTWLSLKYVENPRPTEHLNLISVRRYAKNIVLFPRYGCICSVVFMRRFVLRVHEMCARFIFKKNFNDGKMRYYYLFSCAVVTFLYFPYLYRRHFCAFASRAGQGGSWPALQISGPATDPPQIYCNL